MALHAIVHGEWHDKTREGADPSVDALEVEGVAAVGEDSDDVIDDVILVANRTCWLRHGRVLCKPRFQFRFFEAAFTVQTSRPEPLFQLGDTGGGHDEVFGVEKNETEKRRERYGSTMAVAVATTITMPMAMQKSTSQDKLVNESGPSPPPLSPSSLSRT